MDELFCPITSSGSQSSPPSPFSIDGGGVPMLELLSCEILEQWMGDDDDGLGNKKHDADGAAGSSSAGDNDQSGDAPPAPAAKKWGRKPGFQTDGHVEAERKRRDKLNRLFCELRGAVPTVSRMDRASLLADATSYIAELRGRVDKLEAEAKQAKVVASPSSLEEKLEVRMVGREQAALRLTTTAARHAPARLMDALRLLDLPVQHATVCRAGGVTVQDAVVDVPAGPLQDEAWLRAALLHRLHAGKRLPVLFPNQLS